MGGDGSAAAVFGLLSDEIRIDILREVAVAQHERRRQGSAQLSFSEIYDRVAVDNTSKLSYHLGELAGTFLRKDEAGYSFTHAGEQIVRFILAENYEQPRDFGPVPVDGECAFCGAADLQARPNHQMLLVECRACEHPVMAYEIPPAQPRSREGEALIRSITQRYSTHYQQIRNGLCPQCSGLLSTTVLEPEEFPLPTPAESQPAFAVVDDCEDCLRTYSAPMTFSVAYHPASIAFHWERGVDITTTGIWECWEHLRDDRWRAQRRSTDPEEYEVELRHDAHALRLVLDADAEVTRTERVRRRSGADG